MPEVQKIQWRRGTAAAWTSANPVLSEGTPGFETDTGKFKVGDGVKDWKTLGYKGDVTLSGAESLSNKTIVSPTISNPAISGTAAAPAKISASGTDPNVGLVLQTRGTGAFGIKDGAGGSLLNIIPTPSGTSWLQINNGAGATPKVAIAAKGATGVVVGLELNSQAGGPVTINGVPLIETNTVATLTNKTLTTPTITNPTVTDGTINGNPFGEKVAPPATATSPGKQGQFATDAQWLYVCHNTNVWFRCAIATW